jgi:hypothetical protein
VADGELFAGFDGQRLGARADGQAGWFLATLDRTFVLERLQETLT